MTIIADPHYKGLIEQYLAQSGFLHADLVLVHLDRKGERGDATVSGNLGTAKTYIESGARVLLLGLAPQRDYMKYPEWDKQLFSGEVVGFVRVLSLTPKKLERALLSLLNKS